MERNRSTIDATTHLLEFSKVEFFENSIFPDVWFEYARPEVGNLSFRACVSIRSITYPNFIKIAQVDREIELV